MDLHRPVMLDEALTGLDVRAGGTYFDCTFGRGGHARAILERLAGSGALHALDQDPEAVAAAQPLVGLHRNFTIHHANFAELRAVAQAAGVVGKVDGVLMDLGVSSPQFDDARRGFSFAQDGPLDMRMDPQAGESAAAWLARADEAAIASVLWQYGEERNSRRIAKRIVAQRGAEPIATTAQLAALIAAVPGPRSNKIHPATRSFQAIRIHINRELEVLQEALAQALDVLAPGGRLAVIAFHSLEDRMVKRFIRDAGKPAERIDTPFAIGGEPGALDKLGKFFPGAAECAANPRARSAVLRVARKVAA
ncbi:MAG TPA: 16S rRNA (cytosine(1402)-N(4))-methyltransferase RsmH [Candidatus Binatia bacterium]|nr:16S rRNA (cytosine(1402)-N(4))-methyltransferase RsmH [Candidatus Binatia bacterium]